MTLISIKTTFPNKEIAKKISLIILEKKLAACVQFLEIESSYIWKNNIESANEILAIIKSKKSNFKKISRIISGNHPYDTPEIIATKITNCSRKYKNWTIKNI
jgi:periplasmic divalent cation tolerance protein